MWTTNPKLMTTALPCSLLAALWERVTDDGMGVDREEGGIIATYLPLTVQDCEAYPPLGESGAHYIRLAQPVSTEPVSAWLALRLPCEPGEHRWGCEEGIARDQVCVCLDCGVTHLIIATETTPPPMSLVHDFPCDHLTEGDPPLTECRCKHCGKPHLRHLEG